MKNPRWIKLGPVLLFVLILVLSVFDSPPSGQAGEPVFRFFVHIGVSFFVSSMLGFTLVYISLIQGIAVKPQIFYAYCISLFGSMFVSLASVIFLPGIFGFIGHSVDSDEIGVMTEYGRFVEALPPGVYTNPLMFGGDIVNIKRNNRVTVIDDIITSDRRIAALEISSNVYIVEITEEMWGNYRSYLIDTTAQTQVTQSLMKQASKECVGGYTLEEIVQDNQQMLSTCITGWLEKYSALYQLGLEYNQIYIPNVNLTPYGPLDLPAA